MALAIFVIIFVIMVLLASTGRKHRERKTFHKLPASDQDKIIAERQRRQQETDELITTILPTIRDE